MQEQNTKPEINLIIKRGFLDSRPRQLIINPDFIKFESKDLLSDLYTQFTINEIAEYRYGIKWINGYQFTIGREYQIYIRSTNGDILKIDFKSLYGIKRKELHKKYSEIVDVLWDYYFRDITRHFLDKFYNGEIISIGEVQICKEHIVIKPVGLFKEQSKTVTWDKVGTRDYQRYFAIYSKDDSLNINRGYDYLTDWNTAVLYSVVRTILRDRTTEQGEAGTR